MITDSQRIARRYFIGSSDAAAACGVDPYKSRVQLWMQKTGRSEPEDISALDRVHFGSVLEPIVAQEYARRHGIPTEELQPGGETVIDGFRSANIDYRARGMILECKTAGAWTFKAWQQAIPDAYRMQVEHQMMVCREDRAALAVLIGGQVFMDFVIERNADLSALIDSRQREFWDYVERDTAPPAESLDDVMLLVPQDNRLRARASADLIALRQEWAMLDEQAASYAKLAQDVRERIGLALGEYAEAVDDAGEIVASFRTPVGHKTRWRDVAAELSQHVARAVWANAVRKHSKPKPRELIVKPPRRSTTP